MQQLEEALKQLAQGSGSSQSLTQVRRWDSACQKLSDASLALISVAGEMRRSWRIRRWIATST